MISKEEKTNLITNYKTHEKDTGSAQVQIAVLTARIQQLTDHLKGASKDFSSRRGLLKMVGRRRRLLKYLKSADLSAYTALITRLGIRK
ncbi:MAG: ribosomal protein [Bacteriovoracaceae bacterium]|nr:ribosomal protein [Bacteriovoracaceae bacterium]